MASESGDRGEATSRPGLRVNTRQRLACGSPIDSAFLARVAPGREGLS